MTNEAKHFYEFGPYRIDPDERLLLRGQERVPLPPKAFETLLILVNGSQRVVSKDDLMKSLWPDTFVEEANLSQNIFVLRKALGETAQDARYIVTVAGRGYRFAQKVSQVTDKPVVEELVVSSQSQVQLTVKSTETSASRLVWLGLAIVIAVGGFAAYSWSHRARQGKVAAPPAASLQARPSIAVLGLVVPKTYGCRPPSPKC